MAAEHDGIVGWTFSHWPGFVGILIGIGGLLASIRGYFDRRSIAEAQLNKIRSSVESEAQKLLDVRAAQISDNASRMQSLEAKVAALTQLYGEAVVALQSANTENIAMRRQVAGYEASDLEMRKQIRNQNDTIEGLRERITELERGRGSAEV